MSERYKQALSELDPNQRTCFLYLERQINEIKTSPLNAVSDIEKRVNNDMKKLFDVLSEFEEALKTAKELNQKMSSWNPDYMDKTKKEYLDAVNRLKRELAEEIDAGRKLWNIRIEKLDQLYHKFDEFFEKHPEVRRQKIR